MSDEQELIRERAYAIWQAEGSPEGRHDQHWQQAASEIAQAQADAAQGGDETLSIDEAPPPSALSPDAAADAGTPAKPRKAPARRASPSKTGRSKTD